MTSCPADKPSDWAGLVNQRIDPLMLESVQLSLKRGPPHGTERWTEKTDKRLGLESTLHDPVEAEEEESEEKEAYEAHKISTSVPLRVSGKKPVKRFLLKK